MNNGPLLDYEVSLLMSRLKESQARMDMMRILMVAYPSSIAVKSLLAFIGADRSNPGASEFQDFIRLINSRIYINKRIKECGFIVDRTGSTPADRYFLRRI